jgi:uncharacterized protein HemX
MNEQIKTIRIITYLLILIIIIIGVALFLFWNNKNQDINLLKELVKENKELIDEKFNQNMDKIKNLEKRANETLGKLNNDIRELKELKENMNKELTVIKENNDTIAKALENFDKELEKRKELLKKIAEMLGIDLFKGELNE